MFTIETFPATVQQTTDSERKALDICESMAYVSGFARVVDSSESVNICHRLTNV